jgi:starch synthase
MKKKRVLIISQEISPYLDYTNMGKICNALPKHLLNEGVEMRILTPRFGNVNERRHKLHEVVRLSGINIVMGDDDMPLIIKVASLPSVRIQVYFLDNEEFFGRKFDFRDEKEKFYADNAERMIFFCKGAMEIVKKFAWPPDLIHCHGWMTSLIPLYMKTAYKKEPVFLKSKIVSSIYKNDFKETLNKNFGTLGKSDGVTAKDFELFKPATNTALLEGAINYSDGVILGDEETDKAVLDFIKAKKKPKLDFGNLDEDYLVDYVEFYKKLMTAKK